jgi:hypothetical protein
VGYHSLTTTTHSSNVNLPSSGQHVTARLSARTVSVAGGNSVQDLQVRGTTIHTTDGEKIKLRVVYFPNQKHTPTVIMSREFVAEQF